MEKSIIKTLAYFDIFDYPLTFYELKKYLPVEINLSDDELYDLIDTIPIVQESEGYYYLLGRSRICAVRHDRQSTSLHKHTKAKVISKILSFIPTIEYIGISGSLSMNNARNSDDIDLFIITKRNSLWISRFLVNTTLILLKQKRMKRARDYKDKICPNMFMSLDNISFENTKKTFYCAHEIAQMVTLFDRKNAYQRLLSKNQWVKKYLPNAPLNFSKNRKKKSSFFEKLLKPIDLVFYQLQKMYMGKITGSEKVKFSKAYFHPHDRQRIIMEMYKLRVKKYLKLNTENIWVETEDAKYYMDDEKIRILN